MGTDGQNFDVLMNAAGDIMIVFKASASKSEKPLFVYDGRKHGILYKTKKDAIPFSPLPKEVQDSMKKRKEILCVEVADGAIVAQYSAKLEVQNGTA